MSDLAWMDAAQQIMDEVKACNDQGGACYWVKPPGLLIPVKYPCAEHVSEP